MKQLVCTSWLGSFQVVASSSGICHWMRLEGQRRLRGHSSPSQKTHFHEGRSRAISFARSISLRIP